jgi:hypothetical protein
VDGSLG